MAISIVAIMSILPLIPGLVRDAMKIVDAIKGDPETPEEAKRKVEAVEAELREVLQRVADAPLPPRQP